MSGALATFVGAPWATSFSEILDMRRTLHSMEKHTAIDVGGLRERVRARSELPPPAVARAYREASGTTQQEIGRIVGVSGAAVHAWETSKRRVSREHVAAYAAVLRALAGDE
jgi:DNA-binding XRE family transcriptional regulator